MAKNMRLTGKIEINKVTLRRIEEGLPDLAMQMAQAIVEEAAKIAKENVDKGHSTGMHPGPHPHRWPHEDTGNLSESIKTYAKVDGFRVDAALYTDVPYGAHLEMGFHVPARLNPNDPNSPIVMRFYQYPFIQPAIQQAANHLDLSAGVTARKFLSNIGRERAGRAAVETFEL